MTLEGMAGASSWRAKGWVGIGSCWALAINITGKRLWTVSHHTIQTYLPQTPWTLEYFGPIYGIGPDTVLDWEERVGGHHQQVPPRQQSRQKLQRGSEQGTATQVILIGTSLSLALE